MLAGNNMSPRAVVQVLRKQGLSILFIVFLFLAFGVRLYKIDTPLADWHSFRQADTASVTREYVKHGVDFLHPHYQDLSNIQSGHDNLEGYRMVEFPLINGILANILRAQPRWDLVIVSRVASVMATTLAIALLGWLVWRLESPTIGTLAVLTWAVLPYAIYYGRTILPEPFLLFFILAALVAWFLWLKKAKGGDTWLIATGVLAGTALLVKPVAVFFLPAFMGMLWQFPDRIFSYHKRWSCSWINLIKVIVVAGLALLPVLWWRQWILHFPTGIPVSNWLLNGNGIRLKPAWWRWLFADRIGRLMFGYWGAPLALFGLVFTFPDMVQLRVKGSFKILKRMLLLLSTWFSYGGTLLGLAVGLLAYLVVFASGNVQHDYYQILLLPLLVWLWAKGARAIIAHLSNTFQKVLMTATVVVIGLFSIFFSWYFVKDWFHINNWPIVRAGAAVDRLVPADALVIAPYMGDTAFLFQTNRRGWPIGFEIDKKRSMGAQFYVSTSKDDEVGELRQDYAVMEETEDYIIFDLREKK
jgi:hypothetical protein